MLRRTLPYLLALVAAAGVCGAASAVETRTYFVSGLKSKADVEQVIAAVKKLPSVTDVAVAEPNKALAVKFDSHVISHGQVAYAILAARAGHDTDVKMRFAVPQYAEGDNAARVDLIMKRHPDLATVTLVDKKKGIWEATILPYKLDPARPGPQGFRCGALLHPIHDKKPKGQELEFQFLGPHDLPDPL